MLRRLTDLTNVTRYRRKRGSRVEQFEDRVLLATFHVNGDTGSDTNTGGAADPFATIQTAVDAADFGAGDDTIQVHAASTDYAPAVINDTSGMLTIQSAPGVVIADRHTATVDLDLRIEGGAFRGEVIEATGTGDLLVRNVTSLGEGDEPIIVDGLASVDVFGSSFTSIRGKDGAQFNAAVTATDVTTLRVRDHSVGGLIFYPVWATRVDRVEYIDVDIDEVWGLRADDVGDIVMDDVRQVGVGAIAHIHNFRSVQIRNVVVTPGGGTTTGGISISSPDTPTRPPVLIEDSFLSDPLRHGHNIFLGDVGHVIVDNVESDIARRAGLHVSGAESVTVSNSSFNDNEDEGIFLEDIAGNIFISDTTVNGNGHTGGGHKGVDGARIGGSVNLTDVTIESNATAGVEFVDVTGAVNVTDTTIRDNDQNGLSLRRVGDITIGGSTVDDNSSTFSGFYATETGSVDISDTSFSNNGFDGAGIFTINGDATLTNVTAHGNENAGVRMWHTQGVTVSGGSFGTNASHGVQLEDTEGISIDGVSVVGNGHTPVYFGTSQGAGIAVINTSAAPTSITNSGVVGNQAEIDGGGIWIQTPGLVTIENVTVGENQTTMDGGGVVIAGGTTATLNNVTIASNMATGPGGGLLIQGSATIGNSIFADNTALSDPDLSGPFTSAGFNIVRDPTGSFGFDLTDRVGVNPRLAAPADNGGGSLTMRLLDGSPAIDTGNDAAAPIADQRGVPRPQGPRSDVGAYERPQFLVTPGSSIVSEAGWIDTFTVVLESAPRTDVIVDLSSADPGEVSVTPMLTFTPTNWDQPQVATLTGIDDLIVDGNQTTEITITVNPASDSEFHGARDTLSVDTLDDDVAAFSWAHSDDETVVSETGTTDTFTVWLDRGPLSDVIIDVAGLAGETDVSPTSLTFTPTNWDQPQVVTVTGLDDANADGDITGNMTLSVHRHSNPDFRGLPDQHVEVTNEDDDTAGFSVAHTGSSTETSEEPTTDTFTVVLDAGVTTGVIFSITSDNPDEVTVFPPTIRFIETNWDQPKTVTVTGVDDDVEDGNQLANITISVVPEHSHDEFDHLADQSIVVTNVDDDGPVYIAGQKLFINGTEGDDTITLVEFADVLTVTLNGQQYQFGTDKYRRIRVFPGAGNDSVSAPTVTTGILARLLNGDDTFVGGLGDDTVSGGRDSDRIEGHGGNDQLSGGAGNDDIDAGADDDVVRGGAGNDLVQGGAGEDVISGGGGRDEIHGGVGADRLMGGSGSDTVAGEAGDDIVLGGNGPDMLSGGPDSDLVDGQGGDDVLSGDDGRDLLIGGPSADDLNGGESGDILVTGTTIVDQSGLLSILAEWNSANSYAQRVSNVRGAADKSPGRLNSAFLTGPSGLEPQTAFDDARTNTATGGGGEDLYFASLADSLTDRDSAEWWEML